MNSRQRVVRRCSPKRSRSVQTPNGWDILIEVPAAADEATKAKAKLRAEEVAKRAAASPKDFAALAKEFSQDSGSPLCLHCSQMRHHLLVGWKTI